MEDRDDGDSERGNDLDFILLFSRPGIGAGSNQAISDRHRHQPGIQAPGRVTFGLLPLDEPHSPQPTGGSIDPGA